ncbi:rhomboid family intramembrane serine protease [Schlesneria paludicola]|uniref:rhomboid family intramembrane serine protease n=1 Tax=Schlesneria paludicola TaxID=360056 RepID=UPI00029A69A8|nr:rhomboid family intramembrane serine protease [Schlesneria paludicola]
MIIPYSTDAPIYHFPWMTIVLIVVNGVTFAITAMGFQSQGWLLTYGNGLHPLEWVAYNFLHFGPFHLVGNIFFLWAFGIVVEGKLGWWKYLLLYLGIGVLGGVLIQTAMLGYIRDEDLVARHGWESGGVNSDRRALRPFAPHQWLWSGNSLFAQDEVARDRDFGDERDDDEPLGNPNGVGQPAQVRLPNGRVLKFDEAGEADGKDLHFYHAGAGGASLVIYGLMAIVLMWAPRNEIYCVWIGGWVGLRATLIEFEYLYFCGFYIVIQVLTAVFSASGFEVTGAVGHALGALIGFGVGALFVKQKWVDCEGWDLFSILQGKQPGTELVGGWQGTYVHRSKERRDIVVALGEDVPDQTRFGAAKTKKKKRLKPKLRELKSLEETADSAADSSVIDVVPRSKVRPAHAEPPPVVPPVAARTRELGGADESLDPLSRIRQYLFEGEIGRALGEFRDCREADKYFRLPREELRMMANELFKQKAIPESAALLEEYIQRFRDDADKPRVKLAVLYVKYLKRPTAALKLLATVEAASLPEDYRGIYRTAGREAQRMISEGATDATG